MDNLFPDAVDQRAAVNDWATGRGRDTYECLQASRQLHKGMSFQSSLFSNIYSIYIYCICQYFFERERKTETLSSKVILMRSLMVSKPHLYPDLC